MDYFAFELSQVAPTVRDLVLAHLGALEIDMLEETEQGWKFYLPANEDHSSLLQQLDEIVRHYQLELQQSKMEGQNWNALWEAGFEPVQVGNFCGIRATFHPPFEEVQHEIVIDPKMAFGTGHHETTYLMVQGMERLPMQNIQVLDYGCGTGILAILADKMGASSVLAIDHDPASIENTEENIALNDCPEIMTALGELEIAGNGPFQLILANINRNVILDTMQGMSTRLENGGLLLCSGFLELDEEVVVAQAKKFDLRLIDRRQAAEWICLLFQKG